jgi:nitrite reductase (NADH) large subunit
VLEHAGAFLQLYREEGWYLERTVHYIGRVGLDHIRAQVLDNPTRRRELWERLQFALDGAADPWLQAVAAKVDTRQFTPLAPMAAPVATTA